MKKLLILCMLFVIALPVMGHGATLDRLAAAVVRQLDRQMVARLGQEASPATGVSLFITTPVDVNDLTLSNALARQMQEEISKSFVEMGYNVQEIRKGSALIFDESTGELLLTRDTGKLSSSKVTANGVIAGTYTMTGQNIRFNIKLINTNSLDTLAMAGVTVPLSGELGSLVKESYGGSIPFEPTVVTRLP